MEWKPYIAQDICSMHVAVAIFSEGQCKGRKSLA